MGYLKLALYSAAVISVCSIIWLIIHLQNKVNVLEENNNTLNKSIAIQQETINNMAFDIFDIKEINQEINNLQSKNKKEIESLRTTFEREARGKKDLTQLSAAKPGLIEKIINNASNEALRCMELASGAEPIKEEKNKLCPELLQQ
jgi:uncharacterized membrane protein YhiD involved in acid resistance